jgi:hypothetical protein
MTRKTFVILSILVVLYLGIGLAFHIKWRSALAACRETRAAQGEFVEPEVLGGIMGLVFDITNWPVYSWANIYHDGTPFATPCTHSDKGNVSSASEKGTIGYILPCLYLSNERTATTRLPIECPKNIVGSFEDFLDLPWLSLPVNSTVGQQFENEMLWLM